MNFAKSRLTIAFVAALLAVSGCAGAQPPASGDQDHQAHHSQGPSPAPSSQQKPPEQAKGKGNVGQNGMAMMGGHGTGMMGDGQAMMEMCPMMDSGKGAEDHKVKLQQRLRGMSPGQVKQMLGMMEKHMSMMQGDMQTMRDHLSSRQ